MPKKTSVYLVDDHILVRAGFKSLIMDNSDMEVVGEASNADDAFREIKHLQPDIVVMDISLQEADGLELIPKIKAIKGNSKIIILSMHEIEYFIIQALEQGADGYVTKSSAPGDLVKAIRKVCRGGKFLCEKAYELLVDRVTIDSQYHNPTGKLSKREKQILIGLAKGLSSVEIAKNYCISPKTVNTYRARIMEKLCLKNNVEIAFFAVRNRLVEL